MRQRAFLRELANLTMVSAIVGVVHANEIVSSEEQNVRATSREYVAAHRRGDFDAVRRMWTPNGDYVDASGNLFKAQELFRNRGTHSPPERAPEAVAELNSSLRFITQNVAIEDATVDWGRSDDGQAVRGRFTAVWVKRDGRWLLDSLREATTTSPTFNAQLRPLEWLLGEWVGAMDDTVILVSSHWSGDGKYIIREFLVRGDGRQDITATQRIGWDASAGKIRCWTFDSQGGTGEGVWKLDGERWLVDSTQVLADGKKSKTSAVYTPADDGQFASEMKAVWDAADAKPPGTNLPALRVEFKRAPEDE